MLKDEIRTGNFITILYTFMSALWTLLAISKGVWIDARNRYLHDGFRPCRDPVL